MSVIKAQTDPVTRDFGFVSEEQKKVLTEILQAFMVCIGALVESDEIGDLLKEGKGCHTPCSSCGLSPKTIMKDAELVPTAYGLLWAICKKKLFVCHGNQPQWGDGKNKIDLNRLRSCGNLVAIMEIKRSEVEFLAAETMTKIHTVLKPS